MNQQGRARHNVTCAQASTSRRGRSRPAHLAQRRIADHHGRRRRAEQPSPGPQEVGTERALRETRVRHVRDGRRRRAARRHSRRRRLALGVPRRRRVDGGTARVRLRRRQRGPHRLRQRLQLGIIQAAAAAAAHRQHGGRHAVGSGHVHARLREGGGHVRDHAAHVGPRDPAVRVRVVLREELCRGGRVWGKQGEGAKGC